MTDLSEFAGLSKAQDDGIDVVILHPKTGEETGIFVRVAGPDSVRQRKVRNVVNNDRLQKSRNRKMTMAEIEADALRVTAGSIISWRGVEENGKPIDCTEENATDLLKRYGFLYEQIAAAVGDRAAFLQS